MHTLPKRQSNYACGTCEKWKTYYCIIWRELKKWVLWRFSQSLIFEKKNSKTDAEKLGAGFSTEAPSILSKSIVQTTVLRDADTKNDIGATSSCAEGIGFSDSSGVSPSTRSVSFTSSIADIITTASFYYSSCKRSTELEFRFLEAFRFSGDEYREQFKLQVEEPIDSIKLSLSIRLEKLNQ